MSNSQGGKVRAHQEISEELEASLRDSLVPIRTVSSPVLSNSAWPDSAQNATTQTDPPSGLGCPYFLPR